MYQKAIFIILFCGFSTSVFLAQVTIGSKLEPERSALLDLKTLKIDENNKPAATIDSDGGGLLLPRVELESKGSFFFISETDPDYNSKILTHKGLVVYNLTTTEDGLKPGICVWDGDKWGLLMNDLLLGNLSWLLSGNETSDATKNYLGTPDAKSLFIKTNNQNRIYISNDGKIGIGTATPTASFHVNGNMILTNTPILSGAGVLGVDANSTVGVLKLPLQQAQILFAQSEETQVNLQPAMDNGHNVVVTWKKEDLVINTLMDFNSTDNTFTLKKDAMCEISGYVNYNPYTTASNSTNREASIVALEVIVQYQIKNQSTWQNLGVGIGFWEWGAARNICETLLTPSFVHKFSEGDKVRLIIKRPSSTYGLSHGKGCLIGKPQGSQFTKGLRVIEILEYVN